MSYNLQKSLILFDLSFLTEKEKIFKPPAVALMQLKKLTLSFVLFEIEKLRSKELYAV